MSPVPFPNQLYSQWNTATDAKDVGFLSSASTESSRRLLMGMSSSHNSSTHNRWIQQKYLSLSTTSSPIRTVRAVWYEYRSTTGKLLFNSLHSIFEQSTECILRAEASTRTTRTSLRVFSMDMLKDDDNADDSKNRSSHHPKFVTWEDVIDASAAADD